MIISPWTLLFLAISAQGFFLSFLIFLKKKESHSSQFYLGSFVFLFSLILLFWVGFWNDYPSKYPHFNYLYDPPPLLLGPLLLLYIKNYFGKVSKKDLIHLVPFVVVFIWYIPFYMLTENEKYLFMNDYPESITFWKGYEVINIMYWMHSISFIFYSLYIHFFLTRSNALVERISIENRKVLKMIGVLFAAFSFLYFLNYFIRHLQEVSELVEYVAALIISMFFYIIGYLGLNGTQLIGMLEKNKVVKYVRSGLRTDEASQLINTILIHLETNKPFLNENYQLKDLSSDVKIPSHHISELLSKYHTQNFSELINTYRIEESKKLLVSNDYDNLKVSAIGYAVGFSSKTTFYYWFKKITKESPATFSKKNKSI